MLERITPEGYAPPQNIKCEESVLGAILLSAGEPAFTIIGARTVDTSPFYHHNHTLIYLAAFELFTENVPADLITVTERLRKQGNLETAGGHIYLAELMTNAITTVNTAPYSRIILDKYCLRETIRICELTKLRAFEAAQDTYDIVASATEELLTVQSTFKEKSKMVEIATSIDQTIAELKKQSTVNGLYGVPTGLAELDSATDGWQKGDLIILAARPSQGKTALALNNAIGAARAGVKVGFFSLEMTQDSLNVRVLSNLSRISQTKVNKLDFDAVEWHHFHSAIDKIREFGIYIDETPAITPFDFRSRAMDLVLRKGVGLLIVDYLQLMTPGVRRQTRDLEIGYITGSLKATAKELDVPIIALSQLNRSVESRTGKSARPRLSDLRESGNIENDADVVIFPWNPNPEASNGARQDGLGEAYELVIAKQRKGAAGVHIDVRFIKEQSRFVSAMNDARQLQSQVHTLHA
jgi:replicative DNA helicase